jgi:hypothetical protein
MIFEEKTYIFPFFPFFFLEAKYQFNSLRLLKIYKYQRRCLKFCAKCYILSISAGSGTRIKIQHFLEMLDPDPYIMNTFRNPATEECPLIIFLQSHTLVTSKPPLPRETTSCRERGGGGGRGAESYDRKKAWYSTL